ncbi:MAG: trypsin-like serine protease [Halioglobus sp.]
MTTVQPRIIGGSPASISNYPWMTALTDPRDDSQFCGGSLIRAEWVITAAHCVEGSNPSEVNVFIGGADLNDRSAGETRSITQIHIHPDYVDDFDVALLKLASPSTRQTIPQASRVLDDSLPDNTPLLVTGWGLTSDPDANEDAEGSEELLEVEVPLRNRAQCVEAYQSLDQTEITDNMICAGSEVEPKDSCNGDSGGPLMVRNSENQLELLGVVSFGSSNGCASTTHPGVYSRVSRFEGWINGVINGIVSSPSSIDLGFSGEGQTATSSVILINNSSDDEMIQSTMASGDTEISVTDDQCTQQVLSGSESCTVAVEFTSSTAGDKSTTLSFSTTDSDTPTVTAIVKAASVPPIDLAAALDGLNQEWFSGGDSAWFEESDADATGGSVARTGAVEDLENSVLVTQLSGPGTISFRWKVSSEEGYDRLGFLINGSLEEAIDGEVEWTSVSKELAEGQHSLSWEFRRDESEGDGMNAGFLDSVEFTTAGSTPVPTPEPTPVPEPTPEPTPTPTPSGSSGGGGGGSLPIHAIGLLSLLALVRLKKAKLSPAIG